MLTQNRSGKNQCCQQQNSEVVNSNIVDAAWIGFGSGLEEVAHGQCCTSVASRGFDGSDAVAVSLDAKSLQFAVLDLVSEESAEGPETTTAKVGVAAGAYSGKGVNFLSSNLDEETELGIHGLNLLPADFVMDKRIDDLNLLLGEDDSRSKKDQVSGIAGSDGKNCCGGIKASDNVRNQSAQAKEPNGTGEEVGGAWSENNLFHGVSFTHSTHSNQKEML